MTCRLRRVLMVVMALAVLAGFPQLAAAASLPKPTSDFFVNDFAGVLDEPTKAQIVAEGKALQEATSAQVVAVTVKSLGGQSVDDYALQLFRAWGIGQKSSNNGVLLLIAMDEHRTRIQVGYGLEGALPDGKTGRMQDEFLVPKLRAGDYGGGMALTYGAILAEVYKEYNKPMPQVVADSQLPQQAQASDRKIPSWAVILGFILLIMLARRHPLLAALIFRNGGWGGGGGGGGGFGGGGGSTGGGGSSRGW